jgi:cyanate lyase
MFPDNELFASELSMIGDRSEVTSMIRAGNVAKNIKWADVAAAVGKSKEWTTAACLGRMAITKEQKKIGAIFELDDEAISWLQIPLCKGPLPAAVPIGGTLGVSLRETIVSLVGPG